MNESTPQTQAASYATTASEAWDWNESQLAELNRHLDKPFGEVELFNRCLAFALHQSGHPVQWLHNFGPHETWKCAEPGINLWGRGMRLRILPKPEPLVLPSIDWSHVAPSFKWLAQDPDGRAYLFECECEPRNVGGVNGWGRVDRDCPGSILSPIYFASFKPGKGDWKKLIAQRPEAA